MLFSDAEFETICQVTRQFSSKPIYRRTPIYFGYDSKIPLISKLYGPIDEKEYRGSAFILPDKNMVSIIKQTVDIIRDFFRIII